MKHSSILKFFFVFACLLMGLRAQQSEIVSGQNTSVQLISEYATVEAEQSFWVVLDIRMNEGWHTYYKEPGDAGFPTEIYWYLPEGFTVSEIEWPEPIKFESEGIVSYGYKDQVYLPVKLTAPAGLVAGDVLEFSAEVDWLECKDVCVPGGGRACFFSDCG